MMNMMMMMIKSKAEFRKKNTGRESEDKQKMK